MEEQIDDILRRRGALHIINDHRFYTEDSIKEALREALTVAKNNIDQAGVGGQYAHEFVSRECMSQPYGTCMSCGKTIIISR